MCSRLVVVALLAFGLDVPVVLVTIPDRTDWYTNSYYRYRYCTHTRSMKKLITFAT